MLNGLLICANYAERMIQMNDWILKILIPIFQGISPELRADIKVWLDNRAAKAATTKNPLDDLAIVALRLLLGM